MQKLKVASRHDAVPVAEYLRMSTDHQQYSMANQSALVHAYAHAHDMLIVQTYADPGRTGLTLKDRPGLSALLAEALSGHANFEAVLVYDVSRWGRFQDADESAHYEFICRRAGIRVIYCAEQFASDGTPWTSVLKALKRAMAGEYSRELSTKVAAGKARIGALGFRIGGIAGYGLRRQILEDGLRPGILLRDKQRKSIQTDRVTLAPGDQEEISVVRRIYRDYIHLRKGELQIARDLNAEGQTCFGRRWSRNLVRTVLSNEKYIGNNIVGKFCQRLRTPQIVNPPEQWMRCDGAFEAIVPREVFEAAAHVRRFNEKAYLPPEEILVALKKVLRREGRLTAAIINRAPELPSANTIILRWGSLRLAYDAIGYAPAARYDFHVVNKRVRSIGDEFRRDLLAWLQGRGIEVSQSEAGLVTVAGRSTVEVTACRFQQAGPRVCGWRMLYERSLGGATLACIRLEPDNLTPRDYLLVPRKVLAGLPILVRPMLDERLATFIHLEAEELFETLVRTVAAVESG